MMEGFFAVFCLLCSVYLIRKCAAFRKTRKNISTVYRTKNKHTGPYNHYNCVKHSFPLTSLTFKITSLYCTVTMSRKRQFEEDSPPYSLPSSSPNPYSTFPSSQSFINSSPTKSTSYSFENTLLFSQFQYSPTLSSPIAKRVQLNKIHTEVHQKTIRMMMDALIQLQRQEQQHQEPQQQESENLQSNKMMYEDDNGAETLKENKCTYFQQPYW